MIALTQGGVWRSICNTEFMKQVFPILKSPSGLCLACHFQSRAIVSSALIAFDGSVALTGADEAGAWSTGDVGVDFAREGGSCGPMNGLCDYVRSRSRYTIDIYSYHFLHPIYRRQWVYRLILIV